MRPATTPRVLLLTLAFALLWLAVHRPVPVSPNADLYEHLSVSRHLVRGDGFLCDIVYPLTIVYPWGRQLPQPLTERQPAFPLLLTVPYLAASRDAAATVTAVRYLQATLLIITAWLGLRALARRRALAAGPAWLLILLVSPLLALAASWGWIEIACGLVLGICWWRWRDRRWPALASRRAAISDGALAGLLAMLRLDLVWLPLLWWLALGDRRSLARAAPWFLLGWLVVAGPWLVRTARVTGSPFFSPQTVALQLDANREAWLPLQSLKPVSLLANLRAHPLTAAIKVRHGMRVFAESLGQWLPWLVWTVALGLAARQWRRRKHRGHSWPEAAGLPAILALSLGLLSLQYALFSPEVRHLLVLLPALSWEIARQADAALKRPRREAARAVILLVAMAIALVITPPGIGGEVNNLRAARVDAPRAASLAATAQALAPGPVFTDNVAVLWLSDRAGIWNPLDEAVEAEIRATVPAMRDAPWLRLWPR